MKNHTREQLMVIISALASYSKNQTETADAFATGELSGTESSDETVISLRTLARTAERLRNEAASELHARGATSCELAHPGGVCPNA